MKDSESPRLKDLIKSDLDRYVVTHRIRGAKVNVWKIYMESFFLKAGFQAVFLYRISHLLWKKGFNYLAWILTRLSVTLTGAAIEYNCRVGKGLMIPQPVGIVIGRGAVIGSNVTIFQNVTIGAKNWEPDRIGAFPSVGNSVFLFSGCKVIGGVTVGDYSVVGANAVVLQDVPEGSLAVGVPAIIKPKAAGEKVKNLFREFSGEDN